VGSAAAGLELLVLRNAQVGSRASKAAPAAAAGLAGWSSRQLQIEQHQLTASPPLWLQDQGAFFADFSDAYLVLASLGVQ
jgi:hypothetical protein